MKITEEKIKGWFPGKLEVTDEEFNTWEMNVRDVLALAEDRGFDCYHLVKEIRLNMWRSRAATAEYKIGRININVREILKHQRTIEEILLHEIGHLLVKDATNFPELRGIINFSNMYYWQNQNETWAECFCQTVLGNFNNELIIDTLKKCL